MKSISVVMATLNSGEVLNRALKSVRSQDYDQGKIEIVVADGGSTDETLKTLKKYKAKVISENTGSPEAAKAVALRSAKNEIVLEIDCDNILPDKKWLSRMVSVFEKEKDITGCYTWRYHHNPKDKILNRYFSLIGANDPVAFFLGRADRQTHAESNWSLAGEMEDRGDYFLVTYSKDDIPTLGANGFLIRRKLLNKAQVDEKHFFHIDVNWDLINMGHNKYAVVKNDIIHDSGEEFWTFFMKRKKYMEDLYLRDLSNRRYLLYDKKRDRNKIILYSIYAMSIVFPTAYAIRGFIKKPDLAWFIHPLACLFIFLIYAMSVINWQAWNALGVTLDRFNLRRGA